MNLTTITDPSEDIEPTGNGWCHDNLRAAPFADPAKDAPTNDAMKEPT